VVLPLTGDLVLQVCKSHKSIIIVVIIIIIIIVVVIIIITTTTTIIIIISRSSSSTHGDDNEWRKALICTGSLGTKIKPKHPRAYKHENTDRHRSKHPRRRTAMRRRQ